MGSSLPARIAAALLALLLVLPAVAAGQESPSVLRSPVLTIDFPRVFSESAFGARVQAEVAAEAEKLAAENRQLEAELSAEEQRLTEERPDMDPDAFQQAAAAFDARVEAIRQAQDAKQAALQVRIVAAEDAFRQELPPVLFELMRTRGAAMVFDRRNVFASVEAVDITEAAIEAMNAAIGDGAEIDLP